MNAWITWFQSALQGLSRDKKNEIVKKIRNGDVNGMCSSFEKVLDDERAEGRAEEREQLVMSSYRKGKTPEVIAEFMDIPLEQVEKIIAHCQER